MTSGLYFGFITWWYSEGVKKIIIFLSVFFRYLNNMFSASDIIKTFFKPWKRLVGTRGRGLEGLRDWLLDNFVSRFIGMIMRTFLLIFFFIAFVTSAVFSVAFLIFWLAFPLLVLGFGLLFLKGVIGG